MNASAANATAVDVIPIECGEGRALAFWVVTCGWYTERLHFSNQGLLASTSAQLVQEGVSGLVLLLIH